MKTLTRLTLLLLIFITSCKEGWTDETKQQYQESCMQSAVATFSDSVKAKSYCDCSMEKLMQKYPTISDYMEHVDSILTDHDLLKCKEEALKK